MKRYLLILALVASPAFAQTQPWDTNTLTWVPDTKCTDGSDAATNCPTQSFRIETAPTSTGTWVTLTSVGPTVRTFSDTKVTAGVHCYRMVAVGAANESAPSNTACKTNTKPPGVPNSPVLTVADNLAMSVKKRGTGYDIVDNIGLVADGAECDADQPFGNDGFYALKNPKQDVTLYHGRRMPKIVAARCA